VVLRVREPNLERPFRAGSFAVACIVGALPTALIAYAAFASRRERMAHMPALLLGALIAAAGPLFFLLSKRTATPRGPVAAAADSA